MLVDKTANKNGHDKGGRMNIRHKERGRGEGTEPMTLRGERCERREGVRRHLAYGILKRPIANAGAYLPARKQRKGSKKRKLTFHPCCPYNINIFFFYLLLALSIIMRCEPFYMDTPHVCRITRCPQEPSDCHIPPWDSTPGNRGTTEYRGRAKHSSNEDSKPH